MSGEDCPERPIRVLELRSVRGTGGGPEKTILLGSARSDPLRFSVVVCYIRDLRDDAFEMESRARSLGVNYVEVLEQHSFDPSIWPKLVNLIRTHAIDIVHAHDYKTDLLTLLLARTQRVIPLATAHGWIRNTWRERFYSSADAQILRIFPAVIAVSSKIKSTLVTRGARPERVHQIPNGVDHVQYRRRPDVRDRIRTALGISPGTPVIGAVGRLEPEKRFDLLLDAAAQLNRVNPTVLIVGDGRQSHELVARATALGLAHRCQFTGQRSDVADLLQAMDVYVQTSDTEGIPNAVLEAMATEIPVVATDVGGTDELIEHGVHGTLVPAGSLDAIIRGIEDVFAHPERGLARARAARMRVERELSFDARMERVETIYRQLVEANRNGHRRV